MLVRFRSGLVDFGLAYFNIKLLTSRVGLAYLLYAFILIAYSVKSESVSLFLCEVFDLIVVALSNLGYYIFSFSYQYFSY